MQSEGTAPVSPSVSGQVVILAIVGLAIVAASYAWWHQHQQGQAALAFWGPDAAWAVRHAKSAQLIDRTAPSADRANGESAIHSSVQPIGERVISLDDARGFIHARQALINDASYEWEAATSDEKPVWQYGLRFLAEQDRPGFTLWFDLDHQLAGSEDGRRQVKIRQHFADGLATFFAEKIQQAK